MIYIYNDNNKNSNNNNSNDDNDNDDNNTDYLHGWYNPSNFPEK